ncbi:hypothetical protein VTL71DRAFT_1363 [Oculimacula yallundae]|uniref:Uncharacterized protein n=1 Tax=Oculimacula yallundae TaxID=86028 RepID=A0ABR4CAG1_9HELO
MYWIMNYLHRASQNLTLLVNTCYGSIDVTFIPKYTYHGYAITRSSKPWSELHGCSPLPSGHRTVNIRSLPLQNVGNPVSKHFDTALSDEICDHRGCVIQVRKWHCALSASLVLPGNLILDAVMLDVSVCQSYYAQNRGAVLFNRPKFVT